MPDRPTTPEDAYLAFFLEVGILAQLSRAIFEARLPPGFTLSQFTVLNHLVRVKDGRTPLELARAFQVPKTSMSHSLAVLERHGLIMLAPNGKDGRSKCVWLTEAGGAFRSRALEGVIPEMSALHAAFPADKVAAALPTLSALRKTMDDLRSAE